MHNLITILLAHANPLFINILHAALTARNTIQIPHKTPRLDELQKMAAALKPDIIILDIAIGGIASIDTARLLKATWPQIKVIICWQYENVELMKQSVAAGLEGYILEEEDLWQWEQAVKEVTKNIKYHCPLTRKIMWPQGPQGTPADPLFRQMTSYAYQAIAHCILHNRTQAEMAVAARIKPSSVPRYKSRLQAFLEVPLTRAAILYYFDMVISNGRLVEWGYVKEN